MTLPVTFDETVACRRVQQCLLSTGGRLLRCNRADECGLGTVQPPNQANTRREDRQSNQHKPTWPLALRGSGAVNTQLIKRSLIGIHGSSDPSSKQVSAAAVKSARVPVAKIQPGLLAKMTLLLAAVGMVSKPSKPALVK